MRFWSWLVGVGLAKYTPCPSQHAKQSRRIELNRRTRALNGTPSGCSRTARPPIAPGMVNVKCILDAEDAENYMGLVISKLRCAHSIVDVDYVEILNQR